jgi:4-amino-4-deoxy-L-arabinose transferase-like glycosyltransferase
MVNASETTEDSKAADVSRTPKDLRLVMAYGVVIAASVSIWFLAIRAPFWTDETLSYWQIAGGFHQIWARSIQGNSFAAYAYILWLTKTLLGETEPILRIPSVVAMLLAVYVFYRCARELFDWDVAATATALFILHRGIAFAAIDARPYAFALLLTNLTILWFLRWNKTQQIQYAILLGISAAGIFYFHYLFASILAALVLCYVVSSPKQQRTDLPQIGIALGCFLLVLLPVLPRLHYIYQTRATHSFADAPRWISLLQIIDPGIAQLLILVGVLLFAVVARKFVIPDSESIKTFLLCFLLGVVPIFLLFAISVITPVHVFIPRYLLVAVPGICLLWGWICSLIDSRVLRAVFCFAFAGVCLYLAYSSPASRKHEGSWKQALAYANSMAVDKNTRILMCSPLVEADYQPMPAVANDSALYAPLSYYRVNATVVPLPRSMNPETQRQVLRFLISSRHTRFLVLAGIGPSTKILDFVAYSSQDTHTYRVLGPLDGVWIAEFIPHVDNH